jgi:hypothetical protein
MFPLYISYSQLIGDNTNLVEQSYQHSILTPKSSNPIIVSKGWTLAIGTKPISSSIHTLQSPHSQTPPNTPPLPRQP